MRSITTEIVDTGSKRDSRGRRVVDGTRRAELLAEYDRSGLTQKAFAQREGINVHTFVSWLLQRRRAAGAVTVPKTVGFAEVPWAGLSAAPALEVVLPEGMTVRGRTAAEVAQLVQLLRG